MDGEGETQREREREFVSVCGPDHVSVSGNSAVDFAAIDGKVSDEYITFSDLKPCLNNYVTELWQNGGDRYFQKI